MTRGQRHESTQFEAVLDAIRVKPIRHALVDTRIDTNRADEPRHSAITLLLAEQRIRLTCEPLRQPAAVGDTFGTNSSRTSNPPVAGLNLAERTASTPVVHQYRQIQDSSPAYLWRAIG